MNFQYYDLGLAGGYIDSTLRSNNRAGVDRTSLSRLFKQLRKHPNFEAFGDYPILSYIICHFREKNLSTTKDQILGALKYSEEYKELRKRDKMAWFKLLEYQAENTLRNAGSKILGSRLNPKPKRLRKSKRYVSTTPLKTSRSTRV